MAVFAPIPPIKGSGINRPKSARLGTVCRILAIPKTGVCKDFLRVSKIPSGTPKATANAVEISTRTRCSRVRTRSSAQFCPRNSKKFIACSNDCSRNFPAHEQLNFHLAASLEKAEIFSLLRVTKLLNTMAKQTFDIAQRRTVLTKDCRVKLDTYQKRFARLAVVTLVLISGLFSVSFGQVKKAVDASKLEIFRKVGQETVLNGTVTDPNGAVVPSAEISLFKDSINVAKTKSDDYGYYVFSTLSPGIYSAEATGYGFKSYRVKNIKI